MTVDQIIKYVTETPNNTNPNVLYSLIQQGIATNQEPDPDPSAVRFLSAILDFQTSQATDIRVLPLNFEVPQEVYVNKTFFEIGDSSLTTGISVIIDFNDQSENSRKYGLLNKMAVDCDITAKTSSGYDLNAVIEGAPDTEYFGAIISSDLADPDPLFEKSCTIGTDSYKYTTVTVKCGFATFIFNMGILSQK